MINLREPCCLCQCSDRCIKTVMQNINDIPTGHARNVFDCSWFADLEYDVMTCVFNGISEALKNYKGEPK